MQFSTEHWNSSRERERDRERERERERDSDIEREGELCPEILESDNGIVSMRRSPHFAFRHV